MGITRKIIISVSLIMSVLFLSSCSYVTSIDRLLSPPKLTELQAELLDALEQGLQTDVGNVILKYPNYGEGDEINRKAFILADIDGDGQDETIVFHQSKESAGAEIIMNILDNIDGKWVWMCDTEQKINTEYSRSEILNVIFEDLNGDGKNEIITEWSLSTSTNRCFIIMDYIVNDDGGSLIISDAAEHSRLVVCDLDEDGSKEIFTAAINFVEKTSSARLYKMNKSGDIYVAMETAMDASATSYAPLICSRLYGTEKPAVYADGYKSNNEMITEVIFCREQNNSKELFNPFYIQPASILNNEGEATVSGMVTATMRNSALLTEDINGDGYPDIPFCEPLPPISAQSDEKTGGPAEYSAETVYRTLYGSYTGDEFVYTVDSMGDSYQKDDKTGCYNLIEQNYLNLNSYIVIAGDGYRFKIPPLWRGSFTARYNAQARSLIMSGWNPSTASALSDFAEIRAFSISDWQKNSETYTESGYYAFNENDDEKKYIYTVKMLNESQNNSVFVTRSIVINNFSVISY